MKFDFLVTVILSRALYVAAKLDIATYLQDKSMSIDALAALLSVHQNALQRLLDFLVLNSVFEKDAALHYRNNETSELMRSDHASSIRPFLLHDDEARWNAYGHLAYSIETGKSSFNLLYHKNYFEYLKENPNLGTVFDNAMTIISANEDQCISKTLPFNGIVADIGGGKGQLLKQILENNKGNISEVILFDLPKVVADVEFPDGKKIGSSFFEPFELQADIYLLKRILHDWNDEDALCILKQLSNAMPLNSKLYIFDGILDGVQNKKKLAAIDLALLALLGGKERKLDDFKHLIQSAGLHLREFRNITETMSVLICDRTSQ